MNAHSVGAPRVLPRRARHALVTAHIIMSVGLLGDSAGFFALAVRLASSQDPVARVELLSMLNMFSAFFGIPLSVGTLLSGIGLGLGTATRDAAHPRGGGPPRAALPLCFPLYSSRGHCSRD